MCVCPYLYIYLLYFFSLRSSGVLGQLDHGQVRREFYRALDLWAQPSKLTFTETNSDDADILIYFHRYWFVSFEICRKLFIETTVYSHSDYKVIIVMLGRQMPIVFTISLNELLMP